MTSQKIMMSDSSFLNYLENLKIGETVIEPQYKKREV